MRIHRSKVDASSLCLLTSDQPRSVFSRLLQNSMLLCCVGMLGTMFGSVSHAGAQTAPNTSLRVDEEVTVTADRLEAPRDTVGSSVTVIGRAEIERRRKATVAELLRTVPGLEINRTSGPGSITSAFIRGGNSAFTLVLVDGVRVNSPASGGYDLSALVTDNIERIEIVRGPQSTLYGSEAIGGVIHITTRKGQGPARFGIYGEAGSLDSSRFGASLSGSGSRFDYSLSASALDTEGVSAASERFGNLEADGAENQTFSARLGWRLGAGQSGRTDGRIDLSVRSVDADTEIDGFGFDPDRGFVPVDDPNTLQQRESLNAQLDARVPLGRRWTQTFRVGVSDESFDTTDPDSPFNNFGNDVQLVELSTQAEIAVSTTGTFLAGFEHETREAESVGSFAEEVDITSFYAQQRWAGQQGALTVGVRHDDHETFGGETTWRLTGSWGWGDVSRGRTRLHAAVGTGFRAPSLNELFFPFFGNLGLEPETSEGFDVGIERTAAGGRFRIDLTYFDNAFEDLIGVDSAFMAINIDEATARGVELTLGWRPNETWYLEGSHTYTDTENETTGLQLARRPENRSVLRLGFAPVPRLDGEVSVIAVRDRIDTNGADMDDYDRVDLSLGWKLRPALSLYARAENLLDEDYEEVPGFTTPGAVTVIGLRWGV